MSHAVTITRTTTTTTASAIIINTGYARSAGGLLKLFETIIGAVCLGLITYYCKKRSQLREGFVGNAEETLFFLVSFAFLLGTFLLLVSSMLSLITSSVLPKTLFEFLYHIFGFIFYLSAGLSLLINVSKRNDGYYKEKGYEGFMAASILGLANAVLYLLSAVLAFRSYRVG